MRYYELVKVENEAEGNAYYIEIYEPKGRLVFEITEEEYNNLNESVITDE